MNEAAEREFSEMFEAIAPRLQSALIAAFGAEDGRDAAAEALAWGWRNWDLLAAIDNQAGYLYRIGRNHAIRQRAHHQRELPHLGELGQWAVPDFEPTLVKFLSELPERQRVCVWLVHGLGHTLADTALLIGCSRGTVATHVRRAIDSLRSGMEVKK